MFVLDHKNDQNEYIYVEHTEHTYISGVGFIDEPSWLNGRKRIKLLATYIGFFNVLIVFLPFILNYVFSLLYKIFGVPSAPLQSGIKNLAVYALTLLFSALIFVYLQKPVSLKQKGRACISAPVFLCSMPIVFGIAVFGVFTSVLINLFLQIFGVSSSFAPEFPQKAPESVIFILSFVIIPAVLEELIFRKIFLCQLSEFGNRFAIITSAILFAMSHRNLSQMFPAFLFGLVAGWLVIKTKTVWIGIFMHLLNNGLAAFVSYLNQNGYGDTVLKYFFPVCIVFSLFGVVAWFTLCNLPYLKSSVKIKDIMLKQKIGAFFTNEMIIVSIIIFLCFTISNFSLIE